jgi:hypothetical protein
MNLGDGLLNMLKTNKLKNLFSVWLIALAVLMICPLTANSQIIRKKPPTVITQTKPVFKGTSVLRRRPDQDKPVQTWTPKSLSTAEKSAVLRDAMTANGTAAVNGDNFTVEKYAVLNGKTQFVENRAFLVLQGKVWLNPLANYFSVWEGELRIYVKPDKINGWYLLDCNVHGYGSTSFINFPFEITGPDGKTEKVSNSGDDHLQMFMISKNTEWQMFSIKRKGEYQLASCEVSTPEN